MKAGLQGDHVPGATVGSVRLALRLEGLCVLVAASVTYAKFGDGWGVFALCFFVPDLSFAGYLLGPVAGASVYNLAHSHVGAIVCLVCGMLVPAPTVLCAGMI